MNFILLEDSRYLLSSFWNKVYENFPQSSRITVNRRNFAETEKIIKSSPRLTKHWLVNVDRRLTLQQLISVLSKNNLNVIQLESKSGAEELYNDLLDNNIETTIINNLKPKDSEVVIYVAKALDINLEDAKYICRRHRYYLPAIMDSVAILEIVGEVNRKSIKKYTRRFGSVSLFTLVDYLLGLETRASKKRIIELIMSYTYGFDFLIEFIKKELDKYLCIYEYVSTGALTSENFLDFEPPSTDNVYRTISKYAIQKIIKAYSELSFEKLYFIYLMVNKIEGRKDNIYKLINLIGG